MKAELLIAKLLMKNIGKNKAIGILMFFIGGLLIFALLSGFQNFKSQQAIIVKYQNESRKDWLNNPDKHPHRMAHFGNFAFRKKSTLSIFDFGMESFLGNTIFLEAHKQNTVNFSEASFSTGLLRFGEISIAMILQVLFPLFIFFLGFNCISSERENDTLKILFSQGLSWKQLILGKIYGLIGIVSVVFIPLILVFGITWATLQTTNISVDDGFRLVLITIFYFVYLCIFCVLAVLVSAKSKTSKNSLTSLIGIWLIFTIALPRLSQTVGKAMYPLPSKAAFSYNIDKDILKIGDSHNPNDPYFKKLKDSLLITYKVDSIQKLPFNYAGFQMKIGEEISANIYKKHQNELWLTYEKQNDFTKIMAFFNPSIAIKNLSMALSNTDFKSYMDFQEQAEAYRFKMAQDMNELQIKLISNQAKSSADKKQIINRKHWEHLEDFHFQKSGIIQVIKNEAISILAFLFWIFILQYSISILSKKLRAI
jgi:ABC-2 type transport system permease protein